MRPCFCMDDHLITISPPINPGENVQAHRWKKLRDMWKDINDIHKEVLFNFTKSGNHENDFVKFCNGEMAAYHLRLFLNLKPRLNESVRAGLPEECMIESKFPLPATAPSKASNIKKRRNCMMNISDFIANLSKSIADGGEEKKTMSEKRFTLMEKEDERKEMKVMMYQYEKVMSLIVVNREQFSTTSDPNYIDMLNDDFNNLKQRKTELGSKLGLC